MSENLNSVQLVTPDLDKQISIPKNTSGGNKAKIKKMVVADPGLGMEFTLESDTDIASFSITFRLGQAAGVYHHRVTFSMGAQIDAEDPTNTKMDLSAPFVFVVPFIDTNYINDLGIEQNPNENIYYDINVQYFKMDAAKKLIHYTSFSHADSVENDQIQMNNKKFKGYLNGHEITGVSQRNPQEGDNAMAYEKVLFHAKGSAFDLTFPATATQIKGSSTFLYLNSHDMPSNYSMEAIIGKFKVDDKGFCWMPYTQASDINAINENTHISIQPWDGPGIHSNVINLNFYPATPFSASTGAVEIRLE